MPRLLRRFLLWTAVCVISAAPSWVFAAQEYDPVAMGAAVCLFIIAYTALTSTDAFDRFRARPFVRRTLYIGYGARVALSIVFPLAIFADGIAGVWSLQIVRGVAGYDPSSFTGTFLTTCVSGALLNVFVFMFMAVVYAFQRAFLRPPEGPRGFAVVLNAEVPHDRASSRAGPGDVVGVISPDSGQVSPVAARRS
jgi:hypothetical protein